MKILTLNMWGRFGPHEARWALAARTIPRLGADILCIQEGAPEKALERVAAAAKARILISDPGTGLVVLSRFESRSNRLIEYKTRSPLEPYIRKFQCVEIVAGHTGFTLVNTHLSWKPGDDATREGQTRELAGYLAKKKGPVLLCGDFNCEYASEPMALIRKQYRDLMAGMPDEDAPSWDNKNPFIASHETKFPDRRIDLILADRRFLSKFNLKRASLVLKKPNSAGLRVSDHYGVLAEFGRSKRVKNDSVG